MSELLKINVSNHTEKKGNLTYLSWAWAWAEVLKLDPVATWDAVEFSGLPMIVLPDNTAMVKVIVTINCNTKSSWLPVMDHKNKAIQGPDAFQVNTAIMRCMAKAIAMHGLGLYIYAGEDLPEPDWKGIEVKMAEITQVAGEGNQSTAVALWYDWTATGPGNPELEYAWGQLNDYSALRAAIKANKPK
jgi:hypothetical protein